MPLICVRLFEVNINLQVSLEIKYLNLGIYSI